LHDTLLQGLFSAGMQLDVANDRLPTDSPAKPIVERVIELIHLVGEQGRSAILRLRSDDPQADDLEQALSRICEEVPGGNQVDFSVVVEGTPRPLRQGIWDEAYRIGREAAINAFRHASAKKIEIEIEYSRSGLRMLVRDDGRGIDAHVLQTGREGHWGLAGMRERAERVGANLQVLSRTGAGTEVELSVPGNVAFETTSSRRWPKWLSGLFHRKHVERPSDNQSAV
jgi:signal transduction histidine kinase